MYSFGYGAPPNDIHAFAWWSIAATRGEADAKKYKGILRKHMTREQIAKGQELAAEYWEKYVVPFQKN